VTRGEHMSSVSQRDLKLSISNLKSPKTMLQVENLKQYFPIQAGFLRRTVGYVKAVDDVSFSIDEHETLGLVGESGSGKTTVGRSLLRLYRPTGGRVLFRDGNTVVDVTALEGEELRRFRQNMQVVFQDPFSSLNERMTVLDNVGEPLRAFGVVNRGELESRVVEVLEQVGLRREHLNRYPHSFSGGQRQRIALARALVLKPRFIVADEAVSALDVSVQAQILNLLKDVQQELGLAYLFITHDFSVVRYVADRIAVMYAGKLVEIGPKERILHQPAHPYTEALLSAVPRITLKRRRNRIVLRDVPPDLSALPAGCPFHPRCLYAEDRCRAEVPRLHSLGDGQSSACHFAGQLDLRGIEQEGLPQSASLPKSQQQL
jgi:oligopeptide/dipeptide ABC transporter, ATP-binding protein, C-terminal domain